MSELASINPQLIFKKKEDDADTLSVKAIAADKSVVYFLEAPKDYFDFESNSLSVIDFNRLVSYYNVFNNPNSDPKKNEVPEMSIEYNNDQCEESVVLHIKSSLRNANLKHRLANEDVITKPTFSKVKFPSVDAIVNLTEEQQTKWFQFMQLIQERVGEPFFSTYFIYCRVGSITDKYITIIAPTKFVCEQIEKCGADFIMTLREVFGPLTLQYKVENPSFR